MVRHYGLLLLLSIRLSLLINLLSTLEIHYLAMLLVCSWRRLQFKCQMCPMKLNFLIQRTPKRKLIARLFYN